MTTSEWLRIMSETVAEYQNCVLEVVMEGDSAMAHLIPIECCREEGEDYGEDEED